jgi:hypothetical protein
MRQKKEGQHEPKKNAKKSNNEGQKEPKKNAKRSSLKLYNGSLNIKPSLGL